MTDTKTFQHSYRDILKGTSVLGAAQMFQALISILRAKFIAIFLGTFGMGINALLYSACVPLQQLATFGLNLSFLKQIAENDEEGKRDKIIALGKKVFFFAALAGTVLCVILSPVLSYYSFGDFSYTFEFIALGVMVFFAIYAGAYLSILQGKRELKKLALGAVLGSLCGLICCVPLYYFLGDRGIVPGLISIAFFNWLFYRLKAEGSKVRKSSYRLKDNKDFLKTIYKSGVVLTLTTIMASATAYLINIFIRYYGDISIVGYYQAANSLTTQYSTVILAAIAADYFPRLVSASRDKKMLSVVINRQMEMVLLMLTPLACIVIAAAPLIIKVLLAETFEVIVPLVKLFSLGIVIKAFTHPLGYVTLANDNKKVFFYVDGIIGNVLNLILICSGFYFYGLLGVGVAMVLNELLSLLIYYVVNRRLYSLRFNTEITLWGLISILATLTVFLITYVEIKVLSYTLLALLCTMITVSCVIKIRGLLYNDNREKPGITETE